MHIAIVTLLIKREDGQGRVNFELAHDLLQHGHSLTLIATEVDASLIAHEQVRWTAVPKSRLPTFLLREQVFALRTTFALRSIQRSVDLVIVNGFVTWARGNINLVHFVHAAWLQSSFHPARSGIGFDQIYRWLYSAVGRWVEWIGFCRCDVIVAVSQIVRGQLIKVGVPADKIRVVANGVDTDVFQPGTGDRAGFGLPKTGVIALFAGDLRSSRKNLETVLYALATVPDVVLAVAGSTVGSPYPALAKRLGISDRVYFLGLVSDMAQLMRSVDIFTFPSRFEPFGLVVLEASASGLPVITSSVVGACDELAGEGMILIDPPEDVRGFANALSSLATDVVLRTQMGTAAQTAAQHLSWGNVMNCYRQIIEGG